MATMIILEICSSEGHVLFSIPSKGRTRDITVEVGRVGKDIMNLPLYTILCTIPPMILLNRYDLHKIHNEIKRNA